LRILEIDYSRKFGLKIADSLASHMVNLQKLMLKNCPILVSLEPLSRGCPNLIEVSMAGDSWVRKVALAGLATHPNLKIFHLGHFEHSDCECSELFPQEDNVLKGYSEVA
jgi:F-box/leucine-rich repeat protein 2/20